MRVGGKFDYLIIALTATMLSFRSQKIATVSLVAGDQQAEQQLQFRIWRSSRTWGSSRIEPRLFSLRMPIPDHMGNRAHPELELRLALWPRERGI